MINIEKYTKPPIDYKFELGPTQVRSHDQARQVGANCMVIGQLGIYETYGVMPPPHLDFYESYVDRRYFSSVRAVSDMVAGDLVWFGLEDPALELDDFTPRFSNGDLANWDEFPVKHVGVYTGGAKEGDPLILHGCWYEGGTAVWPLSKFKSYPKYAKIYGASRYVTPLSLAMTRQYKVFNGLKPAKTRLQTTGQTAELFAVQ